MLVAVSAFDPVDVVRAFGAGVGGIHLLYVDAAVRHLGVARLA